MPDNLKNYVVSVRDILNTDPELKKQNNRNLVRLLSEQYYPYIKRAQQDAKNSGKVRYWALNRVRDTPEILEEVVSLLKDIIANQSSLLAAVEQSTSVINIVVGIPSHFFLYPN
jgi:hypothetical protein